MSARRPSDVESELTAADRRSVKDIATGIFTNRTVDRHSQDTFVSDCYITAVLTLLNSKGYSLVKAEEKNEQE